LLQGSNRSLRTGDPSDEGLHRGADVMPDTANGQLIPAVQETASSL